MEIRHVLDYEATMSRFSVCLVDAFQSRQWSWHGSPDVIRVPSCESTEDLFHLGLRGEALEPTQRLHLIILGTECIAHIAGSKIPHNELPSVFHASIDD